MTDSPDDYDDLEESDTPLIKQLRGQIKKLERQAAKTPETQDLEQRLALAERKAFLAEAKSELDLPMGPSVRFFLNKYDGEQTVDALREAAMEHGFLNTEETTPAPDSDLEGHDRIAQASAGAPSGDTVNWEQEMAMAQTPAEVLAIVERKGGFHSQMSQ